MKVNLSTLFCLCLVFGFVSCQPEERVIAEFTPIEYTGAEYLATFTTPAVLFLVSYQDVGSEARNGFLIDNKGNLKTIESIGYDIGPEIASIHPPILEAMVREGKTLSQIDLDVLVDQFKKVRLAANARTMEGDSKPDAAQNVEFYGYTLGVPGYSGGGNCRGSATSSTYYSQFLLKSEGTTSSFLNSNNATEIVDWLKSLSASVK